MNFTNLTTLANTDILEIGAVNSEEEMASSLLIVTLDQLADELPTFLSYRNQSIDLLCSQFSVSI